MAAAAVRRPPKRKVLVLNKHMTAISFYTLEKAMRKVTDTYRDGEPKAIIIDCANQFQSMTWADWTAMKPQEGEETIKLVNGLLRFPTVIKLTRYDRFPYQQRVQYNRRAIFQRDAYTCMYCGKKPGSKELSVDHVIPKSRGGKSSWENVVVACTACNTRKANRLMHEVGMKLLRKPEKPKMNLFQTDVWIKDWESFVSEVYWTVPLAKD